MNMVYMLLQSRYYRLYIESMIISWITFIVGVGLLMIISIFRSTFANAICNMTFTLLAIYIDAIYLLPNTCEITLFFILQALGCAYAWITIVDLYVANRDNCFF